jgi:predicted DNA-binding protein (MmcQ/YjbR family)
MPRGVVHTELEPTKKHWITLSEGKDIDKLLVDDLVTESYLLVVENLPKSCGCRA